MVERWRKPFSKSEIEAIRRAARDEAGIIADFWSTLRRLGRAVPFADDLLAAYYCATDPATPSRVRLLLLGALAYFVMPVDGIADFLPVLGFTDDAAVIAATIATVRAHIRDVHWERAREALKEHSAS
jgi:uncharacterized membrane protein YkvA (DUF1232 family)